MKLLASNFCLLLVTACAADINVLTDAGTSATGTGGSAGTGTSTTSMGGSNSVTNTTTVGGSNSNTIGGTGNTKACQDLQSTAEAAFNQFLAAHQNCTTDDDCTSTDVSLCAYQCPAVTNSASAAEAQTYAEQLCGTFLAQGCTAEHLPCMAPFVRCNSGTCEHGLGAGGSSGIGGAPATGGVSVGANGGTGLGGASVGASGGNSGGNTGSEATDAAVVGPGCSTTSYPTSWHTGVLNIPQGPTVTSMIGEGPAPTPSGGLVTSGSYWLVAETVYGTVPPSINLSTGVPGRTLSSELAVYCDVFAQAVQVDGGASFGEYGPLVPQALSMSQVISWDGSVPYTATASTLSLITVRTYGNPGTIFGTYTFVDDYVLVSDGVAVGTAPTRLTGNPSVSSQARDPRCPTTVPDAGTTCDPSAGPLECEYGGDSLGRCTQSAACALQTDGSYSFQLYPSMGCDPNPANCPASFSAAEALSGLMSDAGYCVPRDEFLCNYPEGMCHCGSVSSTLACRCISPGYASAYGSQQTSDGGNPCPAQRPFSGDGCASEGLWCLYDGPCSRGFSLGASMACMRGYWERLDAWATCPAVPQCP